MTTKPIGVYVHIPFCLKKCNYCDFCSFPNDKISWHNDYVEMICREIESYKGKDIAVDSIFFGGGTPSLLSEEQFHRIFSALRGSFIVAPNSEITIEVNPKTLSAEKTLLYKNFGVNRLSIGLQSIHENETKILGRIHNYNDFLDSYRIARECGIDNINIDLMYGIPDQTMDSFASTLDTVLGLSPEHISLYGLIIEENTPFGQNISELNLPGEEGECDMYDLACEKLSAYGYYHYEISNYSKPGRTCKHNLKYWHNEEYIGFGLAAYSYFDGKRYGNTDNIDEYLYGNFANKDDIPVNSVDDDAYDYVMLSLRLSEGFSLKEYHERFGVDFIKGREQVISSLINSNLLVINRDRIFLTEKGFYVSNSILNELI